jgi:hypothetical protein
MFASILTRCHRACLGIGGRFVSWPRSTQAQTAMERFEAAISESVEAHEHARKVAVKVAAWADRDRAKIEADRREIRRRTARRVEREQRASQEHELALAIDALKLAERRS